MNADTAAVNAAGGMEAALAYGSAHYNVGYRYIDWLLTVPLLLVELVAVLGLVKEVQSSLLKRLVPAAALMIILGYPGDIKSNLFGISNSMWGLLSTIPFLYIMYVLWVELSKSLDKQSEQVRKLFLGLRLLLLATWGVYPITFVLSMNSPLVATGSEVMAREVGYSIADILAKCLFGLVIFTVARIKSSEEDKNFASQESH